MLCFLSEKKKKRKQKKKYHWNPELQRIISLEHISNFVIVCTALQSTRGRKGFQQNLWAPKTDKRTGLI